MKRLPHSSSSSYYGTVPRIHNPDTPVTWQCQQHNLHHYFLNKSNDNAVSFHFHPTPFSFHNKPPPSYFFRHHYFPLFPLLFLLPFSYRLSFNDLDLIHFRSAI